MSKIEPPTVLAFERKLDPSDATLYAGNWDDLDNASGWDAVSIRTKSVRGTIYNRRKTTGQDPTKLDADITKPNLQTVDVATLPTDKDTLRVQFTLRVLAGVDTPSACNNANYKAELKQMVQGYIEETKFTELANRYAANLANGRFLWRNRIGAESVRVKVELLKDGDEEKSWSFEFDSLKFDLRKLEIIDEDVCKLGTVIADGLIGKLDNLTGKPRHVLLRVTAFARQGAGQEVFPSQELILKEDKNKAPDEGKKSKTLYHVNGVAAIHSQKIGNALRTIDNWYKDTSDDLGPIAVEIFGAVTSLNKAYRRPEQKKEDFYTLLNKWLSKGQLSDDEQHFVMAVLIRGGVFSDAKKDKNGTKGTGKAGHDSDDESRA